MNIFGSTLSVNLPDPRDWDVIKNRPQETAATLDGGAVISAWPKSVEGATIEYTQFITETKYQELRAIDEHATIATWTVTAPDGDSYEAVIDIKSAPRIYRYRQPYRDLSMTITIIRRL